MAKIELTHPNIVSHARRQFWFFVSNGDNPECAWMKASNSALQKNWRRRQLDMTKAKNAERYGKQFAELKRLVTEEPFG